jgi:predicted transcriptional regulator
MQVSGADHRLTDGRERALGGEERVDVDPALELGRGELGKQVRNAELDGDLGTRATADRLAVHLREPPDVGARVATEEVLAEREAEDAVAKEGEATVGVGAMIDPGGVSQRLAAQI